MKKRVLGIDLGIASLGWAIVDLEEDITDFSSDKESKYRIKDGKIVASGVRVWDEPVDRQGKSLAAIRGESRRSRATIERKAERLKYLIKLAKQHNIISPDFDIKNFDALKGTNNNDWDVWQLRVRAVSEKLSAFEIFRILYHIANHRGFYFPTKAEESLISDAEQKKLLKKSDEKKSQDDEKAKSGIIAIRKEFIDSGCKTIGQYICWKKEKKHNRANDYSISLYRTELKDEVQKILKYQRENGNCLFSPEFEDSYINEVLMYTHPIDEKKLQKMIGMCEFEKDELRFPKNGYESELFTFYNRWNNLKIMNKTDRTFKDISGERQKIFDFALNKGRETTFSDLRKILMLDENQIINLCSYREFNPEFEKKIKINKEKMAELKVQEFDLYDVNTGEVTDNFLPQLKVKAQEYFDKYINAKKVEYYFSDIRKQLRISDNLRFSHLKSKYCLSKSEIGMKKYLEQFEKEKFVDFSGYNILRKGLGNLFEKVNTPDKLDDIAEALVYCQSDETRKEYLQEHGITDDEIIEKILELNMKEVCNFSRKALKKINFQMEQGKLFSDAIKEAGYTDVKEEKSSKIAPYHGFFENNPTVARIIGEFRKTINAINKKYKVIDEIHIELATDVANSKEKIARIINGQKRYKEQKDMAKERCLEYGINPDDGDNLLRFRLAEEQDFKCIYTGKGIFIGKQKNTPINMINIFDCDIDHIIPISRSFNDSLSNKVICSNLANREKTNRIPFEYYKEAKTEEEWQQFRIRVLNGNKLSRAKKNNLLRESFTEDDMKRFISRDLNNTRYATRHIAEYLRKYFSFENSQNSTIPDVNRVRVIGGGITAKLRHLWGLEKNRDESDKHHAQDAVVIACASFGNIYYICSILKHLEEQGIHVNKNFTPWEGFREDLYDNLNKITVSKMVRCSATGQAHKQPNKDKKGYELILRNTAENTIDVQLDSMFRYDIYRNQSGYYCVPIYAIDLHKKDFKHIIQPNPKGGEKEAVAEDFVFSLYKGSYVKITTDKNEEYEGYVTQYNAGSGQIYIESINGNREYEINTSTLAIGDYVVIPDENSKKTEMLVADYNREIKQLQLISANGETLDVDAEEKEKGNKYQTPKTYIKIDNEKKITLSAMNKLQKYMIDRLGNKNEVKKESERFSQKMKSNAQRYLEKKQKCQNKE